VFEDDKQVEIFIQMSDKFVNINIDDECCCNKDGSADVRSNEDPFHNQIMGRDIIQLKNNIILKGLLPLDKMCDENDVAKIPKINENEEDMEHCNIWTEENPKIIKLSKMLSLEVKQEYVNLMKEFPNIFSWSYDDFKVYDSNVIQHVIPLKEDQKLFKHKLVWINPLLLSLIEK